MKFNKWTLGLAAVGLVSLTSVARADEKPSAVQTALANTTISGYVSASANVGLTGQYASSPAANIPFQPTSKQNGFNLDVVKLSISKPEDEGPWASGYDVDLLFGPDAVGYNPSVNAKTTVNGTANVSTTVGGHTYPGGGTSTGTGNTLEDFGIKQAYVTLRTPVGNGIDWKIGVFDSPLGYEVYDTGSNPNYTHSYGYDIEPTELTGLQATYKINDQFSLNGGVANTSSAGINARNEYSNGGVFENEVWHKAYFGDVTYTAPASLGFLSGSTAFAGILYGSVETTYATHLPQAGNQVNYYGGLTLNTPWTKLTGGVAFDYAQNYAALGENVLALGLYATYKATDKLSFNARGEYVESDAGSLPHSSQNLAEVTGTVEYDLWANVQSRVEVRYDKDLSGSADGYLFGNAYNNSVGLYANIIYKF